MGKFRVNVTVYEDVPAASGKAATRALARQLAEAGFTVKSAREPHENNTGLVHPAKYTAARLMLHSALWQDRFSDRELTALGDVRQALLRITAQDEEVPG